MFNLYAEVSKYVFFLSLHRIDKDIYLYSCKSGVRDNIQLINFLMTNNTGPKKRLFPRDMHLTQDYQKIYSQILAGRPWEGERGSF